MFTDFKYYIFNEPVFTFVFTFIVFISMMIVFSILVQKKEENVEVPNNKNIEEPTSAAFNFHCIDVISISRVTAKTDSTSHFYNSGRTEISFYDNCSRYRVSSLPCDIETHKKLVHQFEEYVKTEFEDTPLNVKAGEVWYIKMPNSQAISELHIEKITEKVVTVVPVNKLVRSKTYKIEDLEFIERKKDLE